MPTVCSRWLHYGLHTYCMLAAYCMLTACCLPTDCSRLGCPPHDCELMLAPARDYVPHHLKTMCPTPRLCDPTSRLCAPPPANTFACNDSRPSALPYPGIPQMSCGIQLMTPSGPGLQNSPTSRSIRTPHGLAQVAMLAGKNPTQLDGSEASAPALPWPAGTGAIAACPACASLAFFRGGLCCVCLGESSPRGWAAPSAATAATCEGAAECSPSSCSPSSFSSSSPVIGKGLFLLVWDGWKLGSTPRLLQASSTD